MNNVESLDDLFHKRVFLVPDYQRGYSWESRQVRNFWKTWNFLDQKTSTTREQWCFMGFTLNVGGWTKMGTDTPPSQLLMVSNG